MADEIIFSEDGLTEGLMHFKKVGGGSLRHKGRIIKPNETFWAYKEDFPKTFLRNLVVLEDSPKPTPVRRRRVKEEPTYKLESRGNNWYDIVDSEGKKVNEKALHLEEAKEYLASL